MSWWRFVRLHTTLGSSLSMKVLKREIVSKEPQSRIEAFMIGRFKALLFIIFVLCSGNSLRNIFIHTQGFTVYLRTIVFGSERKLMSR